MKKYIYNSATELAKLIRLGKATSTEIVEEHLAHIKKHNPTLNAVVILLENEALKSAAECDKEAKEGIFRGPLHGIPMTIKEQFWLKGTKTTLNFKMLKDWTAHEDAVIVSRLKLAGAIILGKTNLSKNVTDYQVSGDIYPDCKNPYDLKKTPGGSSGGSAAALAAGMIPIELGGDFGGSIRIPANYCGLYGLKPTENTIPMHGNIAKDNRARGFVFHMATAGPITRTINDLELVWKIIRGPHESDRNTPRIEWKEPMTQNLNDYKIAWTDDWDGFPVSQELSKQINKFVTLLKSKNARIKKDTPTNNLHKRSLALHARLFPQLIGHELPWFFKPILKRQIKTTMLKGFKEFLPEFNKGFNHSLLNYSETMGIRAKITEDWEKFFDEFDFLICPVSYGTAFKRCKTGTPFEINGNKMPYLKYTWPYTACYNASGNPSISIPIGIGEDSLPVGVQVVGPWWSEPDLIQFAKLISKFIPGFVRPEGY